MKFSYEYDQDPRYGWYSLEVEEGDREPLIIVRSKKGNRGYTIDESGELVGTCLCSAWCASECCCTHVDWS